MHFRYTVFNAFQKKYSKLLNCITDVNHIYSTQLEFTEKLMSKYKKLSKNHEIVSFTFFQCRDLGMLQMHIN